ncbi:MAG: radical SAM protein [Phycisphaerae bacterium]
MFELIETIRKTNVLRHPALPCLGRHYTINLLSGCPYECRYCYTQSFASHPGWGKIVFYYNTFDSLKKEIGRMRSRPRLVYFSTACEPFVAHDAILEQLYRVMELLLGHSISILISSKSRIPARFVDLFGRYREQVFVQVGLTTVEDRIRALIEPKAPSVGERLENLAALRENEIPFEVRADPIIPELTDTVENVRGLFAAVAERGAKGVVMSYVFVRNGNSSPLSLVRDGRFSFLDMASRLFTQTINNYCGDGIIRVADGEYRKNKYREFQGIGKEYGLSVELCGCKNSDVTEQCCHRSILAVVKEKNESSGQLRFWEEKK